MAIPPSFIQELLARADVVDIVGRAVPLKKGGANFMGLCPFHGEKSPSFSVSPSKQFYHCFGCGKSGDVITFLMEYAGMSFFEAVEDLAQQYGLQVPQDNASAQDRAKATQIRAQQATLTSVLKKAAQAYMRQLRTSERAIHYLKERGVSGEIARTFGLGYAPQGWRGLASVFPDYRDPLLVESGLVISANAGNSAHGSDENFEETPPVEVQATRYDRFRDRVMFPIRNVKGECIGFGGRVLGEEKPKYLNSPETPVFSKGRELYGLFEARTALREHGYALVTEGYMDVVALAQLGFANAVATLGTACTTEHVQKLFRFTDTVIFSFDGDKAGRRAAHKALDAALPFASDVRTIKFLFLPPEHDPDSFIRTHGQESFANCITQAMPLSRFLLQAASEGCDLDTAEGRAHMASNARSLWSALPEGGLKPQILATIADQVLMDSRDLLQLWNSAAGKHKPYARQTPAPAPTWPTWQPENVALLTQDDAKKYDPPAFAPHQPLEPLERHELHDTPALSDPYFLATTPAAHPAQQRHEWRSWNPFPASPFNQEQPLSPNVPRRPAGRMLPASREDRVLRLLLTHSQHWDELSHEEHQILLELPEPHGPLFAWLESQLHEHGPQNWATLREGLRGHVYEHHAMLQFAEILEGVELSWDEIRGILNQLLNLKRNREMTALAAHAATNPLAFQRLRELSKQFLAQKASENRPKTHQQPA